MSTAFDHNVATPGTVEASEAVILDSNKDASGIRNLGVTNLDAGLGTGTAGSVDIFPGTASRGKLAITCANQTGDTTVTLTTAAMADARVITIPDPGAAASLVMTEGAQTVNGIKTMASANIITHAPTGLKVQDSNASHVVTIAPGDETDNRTLSIPVLGGGDTLMTLATAQTISGVKTYSAQPLTSVGVGTIVAATGLAITENGSGLLHQTVFTFTNVDFPLVDEAGVVAYVGKQIYDFPGGNILILGAVADLALTKSSAGVNADWDGDVGVGTATASNNGTLASTEQDIIPTTATPQAVAGVTTADAKSTTTENAVIDGTGTAVDLYLNFLVDDADHDVTGTACNLIVNGTVKVTWINLGDV